MRTRLINTGIVGFRFYDFPLTQHKNSFTAHLSAACADDQGKFWEMHDRIYAGQDEWSDLVNPGITDPLSIFRRYAKELGLDVSTWEQCVTSQKYTAKIKGNQAEGMRRNVQQTPNADHRQQAGERRDVRRFQEAGRRSPRPVREGGCRFREEARGGEEGRDGMTRRMTIAVLSLAGVFLATYLTLYKLGYVEQLACGTGSCEVVQASRWSRLWGQPVALWGVGFYLAMFALSLAGTFGRLTESRPVSVALTLMSGWGVLFSGWLTFIEVARLHAICRYCVGSAVLVVLLFVLSLRDLRPIVTEAGGAEPQG